MLNLRQVDGSAAHSHDDPQHAGQRSTLPVRFNSNVLIGNLGESLRFGDDDDIEEDNGNDAGNSGNVVQTNAVAVAEAEAEAVESNVAGPSNSGAGLSSGSGLREAIV